MSWKRWEGGVTVVVADEDDELDPNPLPPATRAPLPEPGALPSTPAVGTKTPLGSGYFARKASSSGVSNVQFSISSTV